MSEPPADDQFGESLEGPDWERPAGLPSATSRTGKVKISRRKRKIMRRRRRIGWVLIGCGAVVVLGGIWIIVTGLLARSQLNTARAEVHQLRHQLSSDNVDAARHTAREFAQHAHRAHELTTGPAWAIAAGLPGGGPIQTIRGVTSGVDRLGQHALPGVIDVARRLDPSTLRGPDGRIDLRPIAAAAPKLTRSSAATSNVTTDIRSLPSSTWLSAADHARADLLSQLTSLDGTLHSADVAARVLPPMLGAHGTQRYFVAFQNEAEARGTGGLPGAFAIVSADHGRIRFERFESDTAMAGVKADVDFGRNYDRLYHGTRTTTFYGNSNVSPNFPYAAQIWMSMWHNKTGQKLDGAVAVDPTALSYLLKATGPATLPGGGKLSASNVVSLTQSTAYAKFPGKDATARKRYLLQLAKAASEKILHAHGKNKALVTAAARAAGERRLLVYSSDKSVQHALRDSTVAGVIPKTSAPYVGLFLVNDGGNKLDYYLDRSLSWKRSGCGSTRHVTVTVKLTNTAPAHGLPREVIARSDEHSDKIKPGDNREEVNYIATNGAALSSVTIDGKPATASAGIQSGHPQYTVDTAVPRGKTTTVVLHLREPDAKGKPIVLRQPLVRPLSVSLHDTSCHASS